MESRRGGKGWKGGKGRIRILIFLYSPYIAVILYQSL